MAAEDDGYAISYKLLEPGTAVRAAGGEPVGTVRQVLDNLREQIFDGLVIETADGLRFVDAPEVARIAERAVTLSLDREGVRALPEPPAAVPEFEVDPRAGHLGRLLGGGWKRR